MWSSTARTYLVSVLPSSTKIDGNRSAPWSATSNDGRSTPRRARPAANRWGTSGFGGSAAGSPSGAPASTQATIFSISSLGRLMSFLKWPTAGLASHGGISPEATAFLIDFAHGRTSS